MANVTYWSWQLPKIFDPEEAINSFIADLMWEQAMGSQMQSYTDPEYCRDTAKQLEENPFMFGNPDYPDASDIDNPTAADFYEMADEIECGFQGGEFI
jgi:hypothetical protein